jgi:hypothetical protein
MGLVFALNQVVVAGSLSGRRSEASLNRSMLDAEPRHKHARSCTANRRASRWPALRSGVPSQEGGRSRGRAAGANAGFALRSALADRTAPKSPQPAKTSRARRSRVPVRAKAPLPSTTSRARAFVGHCNPRLEREEEESQEAASETWLGKRHRACPPGGTRRPDGCALRTWREDGHLERSDLCHKAPEVGQPWRGKNGRSPTVQ